MHFSDARHGWTGEDRETALKKAEAYVERALAIDPETPTLIAPQPESCC